MASAATVSPAQYYKLNLAPTCVVVNGSNSSKSGSHGSRDDASSKGEDIASEIRAKSPAPRRSWLDDATANSLERHSNRRKAGRSSPRSVSSGAHTLPRSSRLSSYSLDGSSCDKPSSGRSTPSHLSALSSCDNINMALNNSLRPESRNGRHGGGERAVSPHSNRSAETPRRPSPAQRHTATDGHDLRNRSYSPSLLAAVRETDGRGKGENSKPASPWSHVVDEEDVKLTRDLVEAMRELKDIAEVSRVIDEVDDEEWLQMFIEELDLHLNDLIRMDIARQNRHEEYEDCDPEEEKELQRIERNEKATLLSVALDLIRYLKDRSTYALHRRSMAFPEQEGKNDENHDDTLGRLKALAAEKPNDPTCMNKWQRRLSNLAGTLDKYLQRLESVPVFQVNIEIEEPVNEPHKSPTTDKDGSKHSIHFRGTDELDGHADPDRHHVSSARQNGLKVNVPKAKARKLGKVSTSTPKGRDGAVTPNKVDQMRAMFDGSPVEGKLKVDSRKKSSSGDSGYEEKLHSHRTVSSGSENDTYDGKRCVYEPIKVKSVKRIATEPKEKQPFVKTGLSSDGTSTYIKVVGPASTPQSSGLTVKPIVVSRKSGPAALIEDKTKPPPANELRGRKPKRSITESNVDGSKDAETHHVSGYCRLPPTNRHNRGGSLDRRTWRNEWKSTFSGKSRDDSTLAPDHELHVSGYCRLPNYSRSLSGPVPGSKHGKGEDARQVSEFKMTIGSTTPSVRYRAPEGPPLVNGNSGKQPIYQAVLEQDMSTNPACQNSPSESFAARFGKAKSRASSDNPKTVTSSAQCSIISEDNVQKADKEIEKLKKRSDLLQRGLTEAREERDEKDRRIAVLESRVQRLKKNMEQGRTEQGSVQEELVHLRRLLNQERRDAQLQISELEEKLKSLEKKLTREKDKILDLTKKIEQLQAENISLRKKCEDLTRDKSDLEQQLHEATMALLREKRQSKKLQNENLRLEAELSKANEALNEERTNKSKHSDKVDELVQSSEAIVEELVVEAEGVAMFEQSSEDMGAVEQLQEQNLRLALENKDLRESLEKEQDISAATSDCFRQQVEFLSNEVSMQKEAARVQKEQYETEIERLLKSKEGQVSTSSSSSHVEHTTLVSQIEYEHTITRTLYIENERLRKERDELLDKIVQMEETDGKRQSETAEFGCQYDDTSYTRMRAFDFYAQEAHRDALKLVDRGRQLQEEGLRQSMRTQRFQVELRRKQVT